MQHMPTKINPESNAEGKRQIAKEYIRVHHIHTILKPQKKTLGYVYIHIC